MSKLKPYRLTEYGDHFEIKYQDEDAGFKVAKKGLSAAKKEAILKNALAYADGYSDGGKVKGYVDGGSVEQDIADAGMSSDIAGTPVEDTYTAEEAANMAPPGISALPNPVLPMPETPAVVPSFLNAAGVPAEELIPYFQKQYESAKKNVFETAVSKGYPEEEALALAETAGNEVLAGRPSPIVEPPVRDGAQNAPALPTSIKLEEQPIVPPAKLSPEVERVNASVDNYINETNRVAKEISDAEVDLSTRKSNILAGVANIQSAKRTEYEAKNETLRQKSLDLMDDIAKNKIQPNRLWSNTSDANKALTVIGLMLGGIGGRSGDNAASRALDEAIKRDIDAQKEDVSNKTSLVNQYKSLMVEDREAYKLAEATLKDWAAVKIDELSLRNAAFVSPLKAQQAKAKLTMEADKLRSEVLQAVLDQKYKPQFAALDLEYKGLQTEEMRAKIAAEKAKKAAAEQAMALTKETQALMGKAAGSTLGLAVDPSVITRLDPKLQQTIVTLPSQPGDKGTIRIAKAFDAKAADKARINISAGQSIERQLKDAITLIDRGSTLGNKIWGENREKIKTILGIITGTIKEAEELGALDQGVQNLVDNIVGDPTKWEPKLADQYKAKLLLALSEFTNKKNDKLNTLLIRTPTEIDQNVLTKAEQGVQDKKDKVETAVKKSGFKPD